MKKIIVFIFISCAMPYILMAQDAETRIKEY